MALVMVVEDEHMLRAYTARALRRLPGVEVVEAATYHDAVALMRQEQPTLLVSDIGLPDRSALGLLAELDQAGLHIPVVFMTAYLGDYRERIPERAGIEVFEKPVSMQTLSEVVRRLLTDESTRKAPFSVTEYLQLAGMGKHSVIIRVVRGGRQLGWVRIVRGQLWSARAGRHAGVAAVRGLIFAEGVRVEVEAADGEPGERSFEHPLEAILLDAYREQDEAIRTGTVSTLDDWTTVPQPAPVPDLGPDIDPPDAPEEPPHRVWTTPRAEPAPRTAWSASSRTRSTRRLAPEPEPRPPAQPEPAPEPEGFRSLMEQGLDALLGRDYHMAWRAFDAARAMKPDHPVVRANLARIRQLGHAPDDD